MPNSVESFVHLLTPDAIVNKATLAGPQPSLPASMRPIFAAKREDEGVASSRKSSFEFSNCTRRFSKEFTAGERPYTAVDSDVATVSVDLRICLFGNVTHRRGLTDIDSRVGSTERLPSRVRILQTGADAVRHLVLDVGHDGPLLYVEVLSSLLAEGVYPRAIDPHISSRRRTYADRTSARGLGRRSTHRAVHARLRELETPSLRHAGSAGIPS